jgi:type I restriction enzyme S subunit
LDGKLKDFGKLSLTEESASEYILEDNDVLFARSGATVGKAFIYRSEYGKSAFAGYLIKASVNQSVLADYLFLYTQSSLYEEWKKQIFIQATIQNIGADRYSNLPIVLPSIEEQQEVVSYLDQKCAEIDTLIEKKTTLLAEMENYKKSLIFEYVTGKKEVV